MSPTDNSNSQQGARNDNNRKSPSDNNNWRHGTKNENNNNRKSPNDSNKSMYSRDNKHAGREVGPGQGNSEQKHKRNSQQGGKNAHKPANTKQDDFANIWQQLQEGLKFESPPKKNAVSSDETSTAPAPSLMQAAQVLHVSDLEAPVADNIPASGGGQASEKVDISAVFKKQGQKNEDERMIEEMMASRDNSSQVHKAEQRAESQASPAAPPHRV